VTIHVANPERLALGAVATVLDPPPPVDYLSWAERNVVFSSRESPVHGPYNRVLFPYFDEILRALGPDDPCRVISLMTSAQIGKTTLSNIFVGGSMDMDPADVLCVHPTEPNAERWSKMKWMPMVMGTSVLSRIFPTSPKDIGNSVLYKERRDGRGAIQISGANSPASLSQVTMKRQVQDDLAKWENNSAGDPESQADSRSRAHAFAKIFKISTPLIMPGCRITANFEAGSQEKPYVPCPQCEAMQVLTWENMLANLDEQHPENAHFTCVECGFPIEEQHRTQLLEGLEWRAAYPERKREHRSFWIWSAYARALQSFELIAREWIAKKGDPASEQVFLNDTAGEAYRVTGETVPWEQLRDRAAESAYAKGDIPAGALLQTIGVDCQVDRVEWQRVGWGSEHRRWICDYGVFNGHIQDKACQDALDDLLKTTWVNSAGRLAGVDLMAIDGNAWTEDVWEFARRHAPSRVMMVRGVGSDTAPLLARVKKEINQRTGQIRKWSRRFYNFGTSVLKMGLYRNLAKLDPLERGYVGLPRGLDDEFFRQLTAERRQGVQKKGFTVYQWVKDPKQANEGLDTHLQAEAAAIKLGVRSLTEESWARLAAERETPPPKEQGQLDFEDLLETMSQVKAPLPPHLANQIPPETNKPAMQPASKTGLTATDAPAQTPAAPNTPIGRAQRLASRLA
jgi:phage terminase large subunit GpA-like protein